MFSIEDHTVFVLMIVINDQKPELWGIYSNVAACCHKGEKVCEGFGALGIEAWYYCKLYDVKGE